MLAFFGKQTLELRPFSALGKEGQVTEMDDYITAITASKDCQALLLNISMTKPRIELMSFSENEWRKSVQKYEGHTQTSYILKPQFGGFDENLVICGSEDSHVLVWQRKSGEQLAKLKGHYQVVNAVSWSSTLNLAASASDDNAVKLWGSDAQQEKLQLSSVKPKVTRQFTTKFHEAYMGESSDSDRSEPNLPAFNLED